MMYFYFS